MASLFSKKTQGSLLGKLIDEQIDGSVEILNALDFIESQNGLGVQLYPVQRVLIRALFGIPFDYRPISELTGTWNYVPVYDKFRETELYRFTEAEYLKYIYNEGRCNIEDWRDIPSSGFKEACIFAGRRGGKALAVDTPIPTPDRGFVPIGELKAGDLVFSPTGKSIKILQAHEPFDSETYKVFFEDKTSVITHPDHLWHTYTGREIRCGERRLSEEAKKKPGVKRNNVEGGIRTTKQIKDTLLCSDVGQSANRKFNHVIKLSKALDLPEKNLPLDPYCLGVWLGDGSKSAAQVTQLPEDWEGLRIGFEEAGFTWYKGSAKYSFKINGMYQILKSLGITTSAKEVREHRGAKFTNKHIPDEYLWASYSQRLALLQGLMDTDGYVAVDGGCVFSNSNIRIAKGVYHLINSLGVKAVWKESVAKLYGVSKNLHYSVKWTNDLPVFRLKRKLDRLTNKKTKSRKHQNYRTIVAVEPDSKQIVRCITVDSSDGLFLFGKNFNVTHNSQVVSAIGSYYLYKLLHVPSPQEYFGLREGSPIDFTFLAQDDDGSSRLFAKLREDINQASFFKPYLKPGSNSVLSFVTESDRRKNNITPTITVDSSPCTTNAVRGPSSVFLALDEFAHFRSAKGASSDEVYAAATPATMQFVPVEGPNKGKREAMILEISSPWKRVGKMYEIHSLAMKEGKESKVLTMNVGTAEMNPRADSEFLHQQFKTNGLTWKAEYGGQFLDSSETYVSNEHVDECFDSGRVNKTTFNMNNLGKNYFWGLDLGMKNDATALAIGHLEVTGKGIELVYDYVDRMMVGEQFTGPGVKTGDGYNRYVDHKELVLEDIGSWLVHMHNVLPCYKGATDQHGGRLLVQLLHILGITTMELQNLSAGINSQMYLALKSYIDQHMCSFPDVDKFRHEIKTVEASFVNKYQIRVEAPEEKGQHDDMTDSVALVAYLAQNWLETEGRLKLDPTGQSIIMQQQMSRTSAPLLSIDGVSMTELRLKERMYKVQKNIGYAGNAPVANPYFRRGRH